MQLDFTSPCHQDLLCRVQMAFFLVKSYVPLSLLFWLLCSIWHCSVVFFFSLFILLSLLLLLWFPAPLSPSASRPRTLFKALGFSLFLSQKSSIPSASILSLQIAPNHLHSLPWTPLLYSQLSSEPSFLYMVSLLHMLIQKPSFLAATLLTVEKCACLLT